MITGKQAVFNFEHSYARELPECYVVCAPAKPTNPELIFYNSSLAKTLHLDTTSTPPGTLAHWLSGHTLPDGAKPIAQVYAGHQFGHFNPQLGDGRAHLLGEILDDKQQRWDLALKGSGLTPFSRGGDGKATVAAMLREVLISESLHALGIPSTRSLAVVATGEPVHREYTFSGAVLTRIASSHLRVGTFEYFAARGDTANVKKLADYAIARHDANLLSSVPCHLAEHEPMQTETDNRYSDFLQAVVKRQAALVAQWMSVGFIHGVMNTDNMTISGETIDYGPCAFMEYYQPEAVFSSIDTYGRYAYQNQPRIAHWNLMRLSQALLPLLHDDEEQALSIAQDHLNCFVHYYQEQWLLCMQKKLGLSLDKNSPVSRELINHWLELLEQQQVDFTLAWFSLTDVLDGNEVPLRDLFNDQLALDHWLVQWREQKPLSSEMMRTANPRIIARNHQVEAALEAASENNDLQPFHDLLAAVQQPYTRDAIFDHYAKPAPKIFTQSYKTFCGT